LFLDEIAQLRAMAAKLVNRDGSADVAQLQSPASITGRLPLERLVSGSVDSLSSCQRTEQTDSTVEHRQWRHRLQYDFCQKRSKVRAHRTELSGSHGIEGPVDRRNANKPEQGHPVSSDQANGEMQLHISDDGRGLALHKLYEKGIDQESLNPVALALEVRKLIYYRPVRLLGCKWCLDAKWHGCARFSNKGPTVRESFWKRSN
jgi:hypothetical protein